MVDAPVIEKVRFIDLETDEVVTQLCATAPLVLAAQVVGEDEVWISLGAEYRQLELSLESVQHVLVLVCTLTETLRDSHCD